MSKMAEKLIEGEKVIINDVSGDLFLDANECIIFRPVEHTRTCLQALNTCCSNCTDFPLSILHENVIGAFEESVQSFSICYCCPTSRGNPPQVVVTIKKTAAIHVPAGAAACRALVSMLRARCCWHGKSTPPRLLVIVNPTAGPYASRGAFEKQVLPLLRDAAGMNVRVEVTAAQHHATQICRDLDLESVDMLVFSGGDGTAFEGVQGLLNRPDWEAAGKIPFALVPSGSGNGLAASCSCWDWATATLAIIKGHTRQLDIASVLQPPNSRYYLFLSLTHGMMANLDVGTEGMRWMGNLRFTLGGLFEVVKNRRYPAAVSYLPANPGTSGGHNDDANLRDGNSAMMSGHEETSCAQSLKPSVPSTANGRPMATYNVSDFPTGPPLPHLTALAGGTNLPTSPTAVHAPWRQLPTTSLPLFAAYNVPYMAMSARLNPRGALGNGHWDLLWMSDVDEMWNGRVRKLDALMRADTGDHMKLERMHHEKISALVFEPLCKGSYVVADGESISQSLLFFEVHPSLMTVVVAPKHRDS